MKKNDSLRPPVLPSRNEGFRMYPYGHIRNAPLRMTTDSLHFISD